MLDCLSAHLDRKLPGTPLQRGNCDLTPDPATSPFKSIMKKRSLIYRHGFAIAASSLLLMLATTARADGVQDISKLIRQGQHSQALEQADRYLASKPKDAQARFLKGIALTELNRSNDAIAIFQKLTEDFPELPEPYNNLAVIYAQQKQYEKAKSALEMAIRTHPSYATAHENLGDIYARLASQAYDKALQLDSSNSSAQNKLGMIRELMTGTNRVAARPTPAKPVSEPAEVKATEPKPVVVAAAPVAPTPPAPPVKPETPKATVTPPSAVTAAPTPATKPAATGDSQTDIAKAVNQWAAAWAHKDVRGYLASYARDFKTPNGQARNKWEEERRSRIEKPKSIIVKLDGMKITANGDKASAHFRQHYEAGAFKATTSKTLDLIQRDGKWLIQQERVGG
jgi:Flp pilus assembly protein TadD